VPVATATPDPVVAAPVAEAPLVRQTPEVRQTIVTAAPAVAPAGHELAPQPAADLSSSAMDASAQTPGAQATGKQDSGLEETLLGPDEGPQLTEAALPVEEGNVSMADEYPSEPQGSLEIAEEHLSPQQEAALDRRKGLQALTKGQLDVARDSFSRVLANDPLDHEIRERLAGLLYGDGRIPEAQQLLDEGIRLAPSRADFRLMQARLALTTGNKAAALQSLSGWEPPVGANLDYYATRAALAQELSQPGVAASSYQQLTVAQPTEARWWLGLGIALDKQGRPLAALDAYRKALTLPLSAGSRQFVQQRIEQLE
jgi:MSHA biogenesis protein MshN